jgi:hypothetical protein
MLILIAGGAIESWLFKRSGIVPAADQVSVGEDRRP